MPAHDPARFLALLPSHSRSLCSQCLCSPMSGYACATPSALSSALALTLALLLSLYFFHSPFPLILIFNSLSPRLSLSLSLPLLHSCLLDAQL
eukprot:5208346-Pleurochrysis_carterae.AAC.7